MRGEENITPKKKQPAPDPANIAPGPKKQDPPKKPNPPPQRKAKKMSLNGGMPAKDGKGRRCTGVVEENVRPQVKGRLPPSGNRSIRL